MEMLLELRGNRNVEKTDREDRLDRLASAIEDCVTADAADLVDSHSSDEDPVIQALAEVTVPDPSDPTGQPNLVITPLLHLGRYGPEGLGPIRVQRLDLLGQLPNGNHHLIGGMDLYGGRSLSKGAEAEPVDWMSTEGGLFLTLAESVFYGDQTVVLQTDELKPYRYDFSAALADHFVAVKRPTERDINRAADGISRLYEGCQGNQNSFNVWHHLTSTLGDAVSILADMIESEHEILPQAWRIGQESSRLVLMQVCYLQRGLLEASLLRDDVSEDVIKADQRILNTTQRLLTVLATRK